MAKAVACEPERLTINWPVGSEPVLRTTTVTAALVSLTVNEPKSMLERFNEMTAAPASGTPASSMTTPPSSVMTPPSLSPPPVVPPALPPASPPAEPPASPPAVEPPASPPAAPPAVEPPPVTPPAVEPPAVEPPPAVELPPAEPPPPGVSARAQRRSSPVPVATQNCVSGQSSLVRQGAPGSNETTHPVASRQPRARRSEVFMERRIRARMPREIECGVLDQATTAR